MFQTAPAPRTLAARPVTGTAIAATARSAVRGLFGKIAQDFPKRMEFARARIWPCGEEAATDQACTGSGMTGN